MKPFPEAVQAVFPCTPNCLPDRPWWYHAPVGFTRFIPALNTGVYGSFNAQTEAEAVAADAKYPIPHPGFRAGQIWAAEDGASVSIVEVGASIWAGSAGRYWTKPDFAFVYPYLIADPACPHLAPWSPVEKQ